MGTKIAYTDCSDLLGRLGHRFPNNDSIESESVISVRKWNAELNVPLSFLWDILRGHISY